MYNSKTLLLMKIEQYREEVIMLSKEYGISSELVLKSSEELDELINEYQDFIVS